MNKGKLFSQKSFLAFILGICTVWSTTVFSTTWIDFTTFPDGMPMIGDIMHDTLIYNQFRSLGVIFPNIYLGTTNSPRVIYDPNGTTISKFGILVSGGPTGFFGNIEMDFVGPSLPNFVTMEIIGSGLSIGASIKAFNPDGVLLGAATEFYYGSTGRDFPVTFFAPGGETIAKLYTMWN